LAVFFFFFHSKMKDRKKKILTLVLPILKEQDHVKVLLGMKRRGFGAGKWNGFGGKVEGNETIEEGAVRELIEETGVNKLIDQTLKKHGVINFEFQGEEEILQVHIFTFDGKNFNLQEIQETEEMSPCWYVVVDEEKKNEVDYQKYVDTTSRIQTKIGIPFQQMWLDDPHWFPLVLGDKLFRGDFLFIGHSHLESFKLTEVESNQDLMD